MEVPEKRWGNDVDALLSSTPRRSGNTLVDRVVECVVNKLLECVAGDTASTEPMVSHRPPLADLAMDSLDVVMANQLEKDSLAPPSPSPRQRLRPLTPNRPLFDGVLSGLKGTESMSQLLANPALRRQFLRRFIVQSLSENVDVRFDSMAATPSNGKVLVVDSKGLTKGRHYEWSLEILKCDVEAQEIGVIGTDDITSIAVDDEGILKTEALGARSCFGCELFTDSLYYGSYNADGRKRCFRNLVPWYSLGWTAGDIITVRVDLSQYRIRFLLNDEPVRYCMSLEPGKTYFPVLSFAGNCKYSLE